jgi:hypothetical protein
VETWRSKNEANFVFFYDFDPKLGYSHSLIVAQKLKLKRYSIFLNEETGIKQGNRHQWRMRKKSQKVEK